MKVKEYLKPRPHIIIENLFDEKVLQPFLDEAVSLNKFLKVGKMHLPKTGEMIVDKKRKLAHDLNLDVHYTNTRHQSVILKMFDEVLWGREMGHVYEDARCPIFNTLGHTTKDSSHLICFRDAEFYEWHQDHVESNAFVTMSYMLGVGKSKFQGGSFEIKFKDEIKTIPFKTNTMVIFSRNTWHRVTPIKLKSKDSRDFRYTVQFWAS